MIRGKSPKAVAFDIADGYTSVNPLFLKPLDVDTLRELYQSIVKAQSEIMREKFPFDDPLAIRMRNTKLQRLHSASMIIRNFARERHRIVNL